MTETFTLNPDIDVPGLAARYSATGHVEIRDFLGSGQATALRDHLRLRQDWKLVLNAGAEVYELTRAGLAALSDVQRDELDRRVTDAARAGFQFRYENIRIADDPVHRGEGLLDRFVSFLSSPPVLALLRAITGTDDLDFADGQATAYASGHFLTRHDDAVAGKCRRAAYVFGLTPDWHAEWGGLLLFHGADGNIDHGYVPAMGALRLFRVPISHSVSMVTPFAAEARLSVTGWLRARQSRR